jgi:outer membrane receptor protein involved in Fe transport
MDRRELGRTSLTATLVAVLLLLAATLALVSAASAGISGKISGRIVDQKQQPLMGVTVTVPTVRLGAMTDEEGRYNILNVPAGKYEVKINLLGYRAVTVTDVTVSADKTTRVERALEESVVALDEMVVSGQAPVVDVRQTSNVATVSRDLIAQLPVQELQDVVNLQAGVVDGHFRGGRLGEVQYQVDGVSVNNSYDNKSSLRIDRSLLEEVQVISGTFDAEYGQAMSGVVNAVLRRGGDKFEWNAELFTGGFVWPGNGLRESSDPWWGEPDSGMVEVNGYTLRPTAIQNYQLGLSGPTGLPKTTFLLNQRAYFFNDWAYGVRAFEPTDRSDFQNSTFYATGDSATVTLGYSREWSGIGKVTSRYLEDLTGKNIEVGYQALINVVNGRGTDWNFRLNPDGVSKNQTFSIVHGLDWAHTLSQRSYYNFSVRQNYFDYTDRLYDSVYDPRYDAAGAPTGTPNYADGAVVQGAQFTNFKQNTNSLMFKGAFVSQLSNENQVKAGLEFQLPRLEFGSEGYLVYTTVGGKQVLVRHVDEPPNYPGLRHYYPVLGAAFAQEQVEWNDLTFRAGLRLDYFDARSALPGDLANPANSIADAPAPPPQPTTAKALLAPRLGVSYPISPRASVYFAYGHFSQMPGLGQIFNNADYTILKDLASGGVTYGVMGNPDVKPERTIQYQGGYKHALAADLGLSVDIFYKDIRDLLGTEFISTYNDAEYPRLTNVDFGNVLGFTVAFDLRARGLLSGTVDYTWQLAQGNASDPRETATRAEAGQDPRPRQIPLDWDQRHTLNLTAALARPQDFSASAVLRVASGQPYTPTITTGFAGGLEENSGRKPLGVLLDLRGEKALRTAGLGISLFGRVFNVFDTEFFNGFVFSDTGSPYYSRNPQAEAGTLDNPTRFYGPRRVELGFTLSGPR